MERAGRAVQLGGGVGGLAQRRHRQALLGELGVERHGEDDLALPGRGDGVGGGAHGVRAGVHLVLGPVEVHGVPVEVGGEVGHGVVGGLIGRSRLRF